MRSWVTGVILTLAMSHAGAATSCPLARWPAPAALLRRDGGTRRVVSCRRSKSVTHKRARQPKVWWCLNKIRGSNYNNLQSALMFAGGHGRGKRRIGNDNVEQEGTLRYHVTLFLDCEDVVVCFSMMLYDITYILMFSQKHVQLYSEDGAFLCNLPDLPKPRFHHTLTSTSSTSNELIICGGTDE